MNKYIVAVVLSIAIYVLRDIMILLFISFLITTAFLPIVEKLKQKKFPRPVSSLSLVLLLIILPSVLLFNLGSITSKEMGSFIDDFPDFMQTVESRFDIDISSELENRLSENSSRLFEQAFSLTGSLLQNIASLVIVLVVTVYWLIYYEDTKKALIKMFLLLLPKIRNMQQIFNSVENRLGTWVKGQILLGIAVGLLTYAFLRVAGVPYAGTLALIEHF